MTIKKEGSTVGEKRSKKVDLAWLAIHVHDDDDVVVFLLVCPIITIIIEGKCKCQEC